MPPCGSIAGTISNCCRFWVLRYHFPFPGLCVQVKRLLQVETKEMYEERIAYETERRALRPPILVEHHSRSS